MSTRDKKARKQKSAGNASFLAGLLSKPAAVALVVFVLAFAVYAGTIGHEFVWDDQDLIVNNPAIQSLDGSSIGDAFSGEFWRKADATGGYYRPLVTLSYQLQWKVSGGDPALFHFANVMWNAIVCVLVFFLVYLLTSNAVTGAIAGVLFALHPIHTESVAWIAGRTDVLATLWALVSLNLYVLGRRRPLPRALPFAAGSLLAFFLSLLAKEAVVALPLIVLLLELVPGSIRDKKQSESAAMRFVHPLPFFGVVAVYLALRASAIGTALSDYTGYASGLAGTVGLPLSILGGYVLKLLVPWKLNGEYDATVPESIASGSVLIGVVCLLAILYGAYRYRQRPLVVAGAGVFFLGLAPVLNVIPIGEISAERFLYFPSLGFVMVLASISSPSMLVRYPSLENIPTVPRGSRPTLSRAAAGTVVTIFAIVALLWGARTVTRNNVWQNEVTLFTNIVETAPNSPRAHLNVGNMERKRGNLPGASRAYQKAIELDPDYPDALSNLAGLYVQQRQMARALPYIERAFAAAPDNITLGQNMGSLSYELGYKDKAEEAFRRLQTIDPDNLMAAFYLGRLRYDEGKFQEAGGYFRRVAGKGAPYALAYYYLAEIAVQRNDRVLAQRLAQQFLNGYLRNDQFTRRAAELTGPSGTR